MSRSEGCDVYFTTVDFRVSIRIGIVVRGRKHGIHLDRCDALIDVLLCGSERLFVGVVEGVNLLNCPNPALQKLCLRK